MSSAPYESCHGNAHLLKFELKATTAECHLLRKEVCCFIMNYKYLNYSKILEKHDYSENINQ